MSIFLTPQAPSRGNGAEHQLIEAKKTLIKDESYSRRMQKVREAVQRKFSDPPKPYDPYSGNMTEAAPYCYVEEVFDDYAVFSKGGKLFRVGYSWSDNDVIVKDEPTRVKDTYTEVAEANAQSTDRPFRETWSASARAAAAKARAAVKASPGISMDSRTGQISLGLTGKKELGVLPGTKAARHKFYKRRAFLSKLKKASAIAGPKSPRRSKGGWRPIL